MSNSSFNKTVRDFANTLKNVSSTKTTPYDVQAEVVRVDGNTAWVHIPGGISETPVQLTANAKKGDVVQIRISGGNAWLYGNATSPPTDDTKAVQADEKAETVKIIAIDAKELADAAEKEAVRASAAADSAEASALAAAADALAANTAANNALAGLGLVESVVDTVNWFAAHRKASTDTVRDPSKTYYVYNPITGSLSVAPEGPDYDPSEEGWYELSEAISNYVATHVATTDDGLFVLSLSNGWRILVSSGGGNYTPGVFILDPLSNIQQAITANGITFNEDKPFYIGDEDASIVFDGNGNITISGTGVEFGNKSLSTLLSELGSAIKTVEYGVGTSSSSHSDISSWSTSTPTWEEGKYVWMRTTTNGLTYTYTCIQGATGPTGATGQTGATGATGPEAVVTISVSSINYKTSSATLVATLRVNGTITTPTSYKWTKGTSTTSLGTSSTLTVSDLDAVYNCTVEW